MPEAEQITVLLQKAEQGSPEANEQLFALVEKDLRAIARKRKRMMNVAADVSTTMLVDDVFLHLVGKDVTVWHPGDRRKFFGYVSRKIHDLLIQAARREGAAKRGGDRQRVEGPGQDMADPRNGTQADHDALLDLKEALDRFERFAPNDAAHFRMRYFLGCTHKEAAEILGISESESKEIYKRTQLWLRRALKGYEDDA